ncbi:DUF7033 domain-containing protein [Candidatus Nitrospira bockiana]
MPDHLVLQYDGPHKAAVEYGMRILASSLACRVVSREGSIPADDESVVVSYGGEVPARAGRKHLHFHQARMFWSSFGLPESLPASPLHRVPTKDLHLTSDRHLEEDLIVPFANEKHAGGPVHWVARGGPSRILVCELDLVASTFFWVTRYEEMFGRQADALGRVKEDTLRCVEERCHQRPVVDEYAEVFLQWVRQIAPSFRPRSRGLRVVITHDIDTGIPVRGGLEYVDCAARGLCRHAIRYGRVRAGFDACVQWLQVGAKVRSYVQHFIDLIRFDQAHGFTSQFFLMANGTHPLDARYDILSEYSKNVIRGIQGAGGTIGLHVGINAHTDERRCKQEWADLEQACGAAVHAARSHYLVWDPRRTYRHLAAAGCTIDSSSGFSGYMGFRSGTSRPHRAFDLLTESVSPIWEYPQTLMDINVLAVHAESDEERCGRVRQMVERVAAHGGCMVVNWHNAYFYGDYVALYGEILRVLGEQGTNLSLDDHDPYASHIA